MVRWTSLGCTFVLNGPPICAAFPTTILLHCPWSRGICPVGKKWGIGKVVFRGAGVWVAAFVNTKRGREKEVVFRP
jgi:hypothetical protein